MHESRSQQQSKLKLSACDCGSINISYKSVTQHFTREEFYQYATAITQFFYELQMDSGPRSDIPHIPSIQSPQHLEKDKDRID